VELARELVLEHVEVGGFARDRGLLDGYDADFQCDVLNDEKVLDELEPIMVDGAVVLDYHSCDWFPERWIQIVVVLRCNTEILYERLLAKGYTGKKLENNMDHECTPAYVEETREAYPRAMFFELPSNTYRDRARNLQLVKDAYQEFQKGWGNGRDSVDPAK